MERCALPLCELVMKEVNSLHITTIGAISASSLWRSWRGANLHSELFNRLSSTRQEQKRHSIMKYLYRSSPSKQI
jgi:hypothetical protein